MNNIDGEYDLFKIEAWVKYGYNIVIDPFDADIISVSDQLTPLATTLVESIEKEEKKIFLDKKYNFNEVLEIPLKLSMI